MVLRQPYLVKIGIISCILSIMACPQAFLDYTQLTFPSEYQVLLALIEDYNHCLLFLVFEYFLLA